MHIADTVCLGQCLPRMFLAVNNSIHFQNYIAIFLQDCVLSASFILRRKFYQQNGFRIAMTYLNVGILHHPSLAVLKNSRILVIGINVATESMYDTLPVFSHFSVTRKQRKYVRLALGKNPL
jgi:hypothetical protein